MEFQKPKYNSLDEFMKKDTYDEKYLRDWATYDFKLQYDLDFFIGRLVNLNNVPNGIERIVYYKNEPNYSFDCDGSGEGEQGLVCWLSREIYRTLWNWDDIYYKIGADKNTVINRYGSSCFDKGAEMGPETMNSIMTTMTGYLKDETEIMGENRNNPKVPKNQKSVSPLFLYRLSENLDGKKENVVDISKYFKKNPQEYELWLEFANLTHSLGNFTLTYKGYNKYVAGDFWDLKLQTQYLEKDKNKYIEYINTFFQWDYVDGNYGFKSLFSKHFFEEKCLGEDSHSKFVNKNGGQISPNGRETITFLRNVNCTIKRRGFFMLAMLEIAKTSQITYKSILKAVNAEKEIAIEKNGEKIYGFNAIFAMLLGESENCSKYFLIASQNIHDNLLDNILKITRDEMDRLITELEYQED